MFQHPSLFSVHYHSTFHLQRLSKACGLLLVPSLFSFLPIYFFFLTLILARKFNPHLSLAILSLSMFYLTVQQNALEGSCSLCWLQLFSPPALNAVGSQSQMELKPSSAIYAATSSRFLTREFLDQNLFLSRPDFWSCIGNQIKGFWPVLPAKL